MTCVKTRNRTAVGRRYASKTNGEIVHNLAVQQMDAVVYQGSTQVSKELKQYSEHA